MSLPEVVSREQWRAAREELLVKEKAVSRARDALSAQRRRLPMVEIDKEYVFEGGDGKATLLDLFEGRDQLVVHHFMFAPEGEGGCRSCSAFLDQVGQLAHLHARGTSFAVVSRAPFTRILPFKARMGWTVPWYSSYETDFNEDFEVSVEQDDGSVVERPGLSCFLRERERVFHTYSTRECGHDGDTGTAHGCGLDDIGSTGSLLDLTALGWQEGRVPVRYHDEYED
ncbi:DUF899 domain-containing protein [Streptomyces sp. NPDC028635]|uniref:DUF899 domain-containing protein n=1 Tax=Streptomyces sp. NPDC028635 TaxID=3154800 RepID=UPI0033DF4062